MKVDDPYKECAKCKEIGDCPHPDVSDDMMGSPMPPDVCMRPIEIMNSTLKKRKNKRDARFINGDAVKLRP